MKRSTALLLVSLSLVLAGCSSGNPAVFTRTGPEALTYGVSTPRDLFVAMGQPQDVCDAGEGGVAWVYMGSSRTRTWDSFIPWWGLVAGGNEDEIVRMTFRFSASGKLSDYAHRSWRVFVGNWDFPGSVRDEARRARVQEAMRRIGQKLNGDLDDDMDRLQALMAWQAKKDPRSAGLRAAAHCMCELDPGSRLPG